MVLAAHSEYFHTVIDQAMKQNTQDVPVISVDSDTSMISNLLQYMYTGEISVSSSGIEELCHQAEKYSMSRLVELCKKLKGPTTVKPGAADRTSDSSLKHEDSVPMRWEYNSRETLQDSSSLYYSELSGGPTSGISESKETMQEVSRVVLGAPVSNISQSRDIDTGVSRMDLGVVKQEMTGLPNSDTGCDRSGKSTLSSNTTKGTTPALSSLIPIVSQFMVPENTHLDNDRLDTIVVKREANSDDDLEMVCDELVDSNLRHVSGMAKSIKRGQVYASTSVQKYIKIAPRPNSHKTEDMSDTPIK